MFLGVSYRYPEEGLLGHMVTLFLTFGGASILFSIVAYQFTFPTAVKEDFFSSVNSPTLVITCPVDNSHSNRCEVVSHCSFELHFPNSEVEYLFIYLLVVCMHS